MQCWTRWMEREMLIFSERESCSLQLQWLPVLHLVSFPPPLSRKSLAGGVSLEQLCIKWETHCSRTRTSAEESLMSRPNNMTSKGSRNWTKGEQAGLVAAAGVRVVGQWWLLLWGKPAAAAREAAVAFEPFSEAAAAALPTQLQLGETWAVRLGTQCN